MQGLESRCGCVNLGCERRSVWVGGALHRADSANVGALFDSYWQQRHSAGVPLAARDQVK